MSGQNRERPVDLLGQDDAGKLVGKCHAAKRQKEMGALAGSGRPAVRRPDREDEVLGARIAQVAKPLGKVFGGELLAATVKQDRVNRDTPRLAVKPVQKGSFGFKEFRLAGKVAGPALHVVGKQTVCRLRFGSCTARSDGDKENFHLGERQSFYFRISRRTYPIFHI